MSAELWPHEVGENDLLLSPRGTGVEQRETLGNNGKKIVSLEISTSELTNTMTTLYEQRAIVHTNVGKLKKDYPFLTDDQASFIVRNRGSVLNATFVEAEAALVEMAREGLL